MTDNGKLYVRFLRNSMVSAEPYAQGEIVSFTPNVAKELVACRAAEFYDPPKREEVAPPVEAAVAPMQAAESAVVTTAKRGRKTSK